MLILVKIRVGHNEILFWPGGLRVVVKFQAHHFQGILKLVKNGPFLPGPGLVLRNVVFGKHPEFLTQKQHIGNLKFTGGLNRVLPVQST